MYKATPKMRIQPWNKLGYICTMILCMHGLFKSEHECLVRRWFPLGFAEDKLFFLTFIIIIPNEHCTRGDSLKNNS